MLTHKIKALDIIEGCNVYEKFRVSSGQNGPSNHSNHWVFNFNFFVSLFTTNPTAVGQCVHEFYVHKAFLL